MADLLVCMMSCARRPRVTRRSSSKFAKIADTQSQKTPFLPYILVWGIRMNSWDTSFSHTLKIWILHLIISSCLSPNFFKKIYTIVSLSPVIHYSWTCASTRPPTFEYLFSWAFFRDVSSGWTVLLLTRHLWCRQCKESFWKLLLWASFGGASGSCSEWIFPVKVMIFSEKLVGALEPKWGRQHDKIQSRLLHCHGA